ncbi:MAG: 3-deoxy-8-phosphooctulonate synthase, partial [Chlamydiota bacterium]
MKLIPIKNRWIGKKQPLTIIAGPCVMETEEHTLSMAKELKKIFSHFPFTFIFKASYDKANRSSKKSYRGPGIGKGLEILEKVSIEFDIPVLSDVHCRVDMDRAKDVLDIIQIPAFLCRQTDFVVEAAKTKRAINIKKGQFLSPWDVKNIIEKIEDSGNKNIIITERGVMFGYNNLVSDFRSLEIMREFGYPVVYDAT